MYKKNGAKDVDLKEVGPRFEMKCRFLLVSCYIHVLCYLCRIL